MQFQRLMWGGTTPTAYGSHLDIPIPRCPYSPLNFVGVDEEHIAELLVKLLHFLKIIEVLRLKTRSRHMIHLIFNIRT